MPLNEAQALRPRRSLTKEEQRRAEAAIYGLEENTMSPTGTIQLTHEEAEKVRALLNQHDRATAPQQFDLNKPPTPAYKHQDFPRVVYHHGRGKAKAVQNAAELDKHLGSGWQLEPFVPEPEPSDLDPDDAAEVAAVDAQLAELRAGKSRKGKAE
jgi:hypothetical protein